MRKLYITIGNIASGKSKYIKGLDAEVICQDDLRYIDDEYVFDPETEPMIHDIIKLTLRIALMEGKDIVFDENNMSKKARKWAIDIGREFGYDVIGITFQDFGKDIHTFRRFNSDNRGYSYEEWGDVYDRLYEQYQTPTRSEGFHRIIHAR